jgi:hypothetical protein
MRPTQLVLPLLVGALLPGCGHPFRVEDALGAWDVREINGAAVSGTAPTGVWIRENGGSDSSVVAIESIVLEFAADSACAWTFDDGIQGAVVDDDCTYGISNDGDITVTLETTTLQGTASGSTMSLQDDATNGFEFEKRT